MNLVNLPGIVSRNTRDIKKLRAFVCNLIPDTTGQDGKVLSVNNGILEWIVGGGGGGGTGVTDGDKGDIVVSGSGLVWMIDAGVVTLSKMANLAANSIIGNNTASPATPLALSGTQVTAMLDTFTSSNKGLVSASGGGTTNFLRADGTWAAPPGNISGTGSSGQVSYWTGTSTQAGSNNLFWDNGKLGVGTNTGLIAQAHFQNSTSSANEIYVGSRLASTGFRYDGIRLGTTGGGVSFIQSNSGAGLTSPYFLYLEPFGQGVIIGATVNSPGARLQVRGSGATSATSALLVENSAQDNLLRLRNDGASSLGFNATVNNAGQAATANGRISTDGDAQSSNIRLFRSITGDATSAAQTELFTNGSSSRLTLPSGNSIWNAKIQLVAVCSNAGTGNTIVLGESFVGDYFLGIKRIGSSTTLIGGSSSITSTEIADTSMLTSIVTIDADDTNEALRIQFTPPTTAAGNSTIRVVATVYLTETKY